MSKNHRKPCWDSHQCGIVELGRWIRIGAQRHWLSWLERISEETRWSRIHCRFWHFSLGGSGTTSMLEIAGGSLMLERCTVHCGVLRFLWKSFGEAKLRPMIPKLPLNATRQSEAFEGNFKRSLWWMHTCVEPRTPRKSKASTGRLGQTELRLLKSESSGNTSIWKTASPKEEQDISQKSSRIKINQEIMKKLHRFWGSRLSRPCTRWVCLFSRTRLCVPVIADSAGPELRWLGRHIVQPYQDEAIQEKQRCLELVESLWKKI